MNDEQKERFRKYVEFYWDRYKFITGEEPLYSKLPEPINELDQIMNKLNTQSNAIVAIRSRQFIVGSMTDTGNFSVSPSPSVHNTLSEAKTEAKRLASLTPGKMYVPLQLAGGELVPNATISL